MIEINSNTYAKKCVLKIKVIEKDNKSVLWIQMRNIQDNLSIKNMSDLTIKAIKGFYKIKSPTKERIEKHKRYRTQFRNDLTGTYIHENLALSTTMDSRTPTAIKFRTNLINKVCWYNILF